MGTADKGYESDTEAEGGLATASDVSLEGVREAEPRGLKALDKEGWPDEDLAEGNPKEQPPHISWGISSTAPEFDRDTQVIPMRDPKGSFSSGPELPLTIMKPDQCLHTSKFTASLNLQTCVSHTACARMQKQIQMCTNCFIVLYPEVGGGRQVATA